MTHGGRSPITPDERAQAAAFTLQVELSTRIGLSRLGESEGILREAITSLQLVQETARRVTEDLQGPDVANSADARRVLESAQRLEGETLTPFLDHWQPRLAEHEALRPAGRPLVDHEARWEGASAFRSALRELSTPLRHINRALAEITGANLELSVTAENEDA